LAFGCGLDLFIVYIINVNGWRLSSSFSLSVF